MKLVVFGDDLTGCNATAVMFRNLGWRVRTLPRHDGSLPVETGTALIWNTGTRLCEPDQAKARLMSMLGEVRRRWGPDVVFAKRIDSTFRGPIGAEAEVVLLAMPDAAVGVVVAAFPSSGRTVHEGRLYVHGTPVHQTELAIDPYTPIQTSDICEMLARHTNLPIVRWTRIDIESQSDPQQAEARLTERMPGRCLLVCDAESDEDIERLADFFSQWQRPILPIDPGPFTVRFLAAKQRNVSRVLVVSGSRMPTISAQLNELESRFAIRLLDLDVSQVAASESRQEYLEQLTVALLQAAQCTRVFGVRTDRSCTSDKIVPSIVSSVLAELTDKVLRLMPVTGLYVSGGEVANEVLRCLNADMLNPLVEIYPLCILSEVASGPHAGLRVVTKGGTVGPVSAITESVHILLSAN